MIEYEKDSFDKKFRLSNGIFIPYLAIDFLTVNGLPLFDLHSITCGPSPQPYDTSKSVRMLLRTQDFEKTIVDHSKIPLRA